MESTLGRSFDRLHVSTGAANVADGVIIVAASLVAARLTRSPILVAGVMVAYYLPQAIAALPVGVLADRLDRRRLLAGANVVRAVALAAAAGAAGMGLLTLPLLYAAVAVLGACEVVVDTTAQSVIPALVARERLGDANGRLYGTEVVAGEFVGSPLAGVLVAATVAGAFAVPAAFYVIGALVVLRVHGLAAPTRGAPASLRSDVAEGITFLVRHRALRSMALMAGTLNLGNSAFFAVFVLFAVGAQSPMGLTESAFGVLLAAVAGGGVVGSLVAARATRRLGPARVLASGVLLMAAAYAVPLLTAAWPAVAAALFVAGMASLCANVVLSSTRQRLVPTALLGRVNATYRLVALGTLPLGAFLGGVLGDLLGLRAVFLAAVLLFLAVLPAFRVLTDDALSGDAPTAPTAAVLPGAAPTPSPAPTRSGVPS